MTEEKNEKKQEEDADAKTAKTRGDPVVTLIE